MTDEPMSEVRMHNTPNDGVSMEPIGEQPRVVFHVDWEKMETPTPQMFHDVIDAQVTLATMEMRACDDDIQEKREAAITAVNELLAAMADKRVDDRDSHDWYDLYMGSLDILDEVEREVE